MLQSIILFESVNKTDNPCDILVIARQPDGRILNVDTPEAITSWYLDLLRKGPECCNKVSDTDLKSK